MSHALSGDAEVLANVTDQLEARFDLIPAPMSELSEEWLDVETIDRSFEIAHTKHNYVAEQHFGFKPMQSIDQSNMYKIQLDVDGVGW